MANVGLFTRLGNLWKGFLSIWISDVEKDHPEIAYENAINSMIEKYSKLKNATAAIIKRREDVDERLKRATKDLAQTEAELNAAVETNQDDLAVILIQKKNQLEQDVLEMRGDLDTASKDADSAKTSLLQVQAEIKKLKAERDVMLARMQSAQARLQIQGQLDGLSVDAEVKALDNVRDFVHGWFDGIEMIKTDPAQAYALVAKALKLDDETVSGMLSGLKLTPFADNAQFYGLTGGKAHYETLFDTAFVIWRKKGLVSKPVDAKEWVDTRFLAALAPSYQEQKVEEPKVAAKAPSTKDRAIINKQIQVHFTPGSDEIMPGSFFVLDALGETMTSFGNTYLRVEGNTDAVGKAQSNMQLSERRALAVKNYVLKNFPNIPATRFQTIGRGQTNPVAPNTTEAGRQLNRRTEIKVVLAAE